MPTHYEDLIVWQKSMTIAKKVYLLTKKLPEDERFGMISQMRRASVSIPSNIAEGHARSSSKKDFKHFLMIARGSSAELDTQLKICLMVNLIHQDDYSDVSNLIEEVSKMLYSLIQKISSST